MASGVAVEPAEQVAPAEPGVDPSTLPPPRWSDEAEDIDEAEAYWADASAKRVIDELKKKEAHFFDAVNRRGFGDAWLGAFCAYYGLDPSASSWETQSITLDGERGELLRFRINEFRSYQRQVSAMAVGERPSFQALASNTSYDSLASVTSADTATNHLYWSTYGESKERRTIEKGDLFGLGWTWVNFDPEGGEPVDASLPLPPEAGGGPSPAQETKQSGEIVIKSRAPWEVFQEFSTEDPEDHIWRVAKDRVSKFELAAQYPALRKEILQLKNDDDPTLKALFGFDTLSINPDELIVKHFYHARTKAMPKGRYLVYVGDLLLYQDFLPFKSIPLIPYCPAGYIGTSLGYADAWDMIPVCQLLDQVASDLATVISTFGRPTLVAEDGIEIDLNAIADGMRVLRIPPGAVPPTAANFAQVPDWTQFITGFLESKLQSLSGLNATSRGTPAPGVTSGTMAALYHSVAQEINSYRQAAVDQHRERVANLLLDLVNTYVEIPLMIEMVGADERPYLASITKQTFAGVRRVKIKTSNPMLRTTAGRLELAKMLITVPGAVETPEQIVELVTSGQLKPMTEDARARLLRIRRENEELMKGPAVVEEPDPSWVPDPLVPDEPPAMLTYVKEVRVLAMCDHFVDHMHSHSAALGATRDPRARAALMAHMQEHVHAARNMDPWLAQTLGFPMPPPPPGMGPLVEGEGDQGSEAEGDGDVPPRKPALSPKGKAQLAGPGVDSTGVKLPRPAQPPSQYAGPQGQGAANV